jgi:hypothetical protein
MTAQPDYTVKSLVTIKDIRHALKPLISSENSLATLDKQLKGYAKGDSADHAALRPEIEKNIRRIEKARAL